MAMERRPRRTAKAEPPDPRQAFLRAVADYDSARAAHLDDGGKDEALTDRFNEATWGVVAAVLAVHGQTAGGEHANDSTGIPPCSVRHGSRLFIAGSDHHDPKGGTLVLTIVDEQHQAEIRDAAPLPSGFRTPDTPEIAEATVGAIQAFRHAEAAANAALPSGQSVVDRVSAVRLSRRFNAADELVEALIATDPAVHHDDIAGASRRHWRPRGAILEGTLFLAVPADLDEADLAKPEDGVPSGGGKVTSPLAVRLEDIVSL